MQHALRPCEMTQCILMRNQRREQADSLVFDSRFPHFLKQFLKAAPVAKSLPNAQQIHASVSLWLLPHSQSSKVSSHACIPSCACTHLHSRRGRSIPLGPWVAMPFSSDSLIAPFQTSVHLFRAPMTSLTAGKTYPNCQMRKCLVTPARKKRAKRKHLALQISLKIDHGLIRPVDLSFR